MLYTKGLTPNISIPVKGDVNNSHWILSHKRESDAGHLGAEP